MTMDTSRSNNTGKKKKTQIKEDNTLKPKNIMHTHDYSQVNQQLHYQIESTHQETKSHRIKSPIHNNHEWIPTHSIQLKRSHHRKHTGPWKSQGCDCTLTIKHNHMIHKKQTNRSTHRHTPYYEPPSYEKQWNKSVGWTNYLLVQYCSCLLWRLFGFMPFSLPICFLIV